MRIGQAARAAQLPTKTVRYYTDIGLIRTDGRSANGYRTYDAADIRKLIFVRRARSFGFSIDDCRQLLSLYEDSSRSSADVKRLTLQRLAQIEGKMAELKSLHAELSHLAEACRGDDRPDCPIIDSLAP